MAVMKATKAEIAAFRQDMLAFRQKFPAKYVRGLLAGEPTGNLPQEMVEAACCLHEKYNERKELSAIERKWQMPAVQMTMLMDIAVTALFIGAVKAHFDGKQGMAWKLGGLMLLAGAFAAGAFAVAHKFYLKYRNAYNDVEKVYKRALGIEEKK